MYEKHRGHASLLFMSFSLVHRIHTNRNAYTLGQEAPLSRAHLLNRIDNDVGVALTA